MKTVTKIETKTVDVTKTNKDVLIPLLIIDIIFLIVAITFGGKWKREGDTKEDNDSDDNETPVLLDKNLVNASE